MNPLRLLGHGLLGALNCTLLILGFLLICLLAVLMSPLTLIPWRPCQVFMSHFADWLIRLAYYLFRLVFRLAGCRQWRIEGDLEHIQHQTQILICNHLYWPDPFIMHAVLGKRQPACRFLIKEELLWLPVFGLAFAAAGFVPLKRYKQSQIAKSPRLLEKDRSRITRACEKLDLTPSTIILYPEGTRRTAAKLKADQGGFQYLLRPRIGGLAILLKHLPRIDKVCDLTIVYPQKKISFWLVLCGLRNDLKVHLRWLDIPQQLRGESDSDNQREIRRWMEGVWREKDQYLAANNAH